MARATAAAWMALAAIVLSACGDDDSTSINGSPTATSPPPSATAPAATSTAAPPTATSSSAPTSLPSVTVAAPSATATQLLPTPSATATQLLPTPTATATQLLAPPSADEGFQLTMSGFEVPAHGEIEVCQLFYLPNDVPIDVDRFEIAMPEGSHHFVVWTYNGAHPEQYPPGLFHSTGCVVPRPDDSMNIGMLIGSGTPRSAVAYPAGIGVKLGAHQPVLLNSHYANAGDEPLHPTVYVNVYYAKTPVVHAIESLTAANYKIFVPAGESRTTRARFTVPFDSYYLNVSSHMHKRGDVFAARLVSGAIDDVAGRVSSLEGDAYATQLGRRPAAGDFYRSHDWANPTVIVYDEPRLFPKGAVIEFDCTQHNDKSVPLGFGPLADDEMCILTGAYYRAETAPPPGTRIPGCLPQANQLTCYAEPAAPVSPGTAVCGNGRREAGEQCDLGDDNGVDCSDECRLDLAPGTVLGTRVFPIVFSGPNSGTTDFVVSVTRSSGVLPSAAEVSGALSLRGSGLAPDGRVAVAQDAEVRIGLPILGGGAFCVRLLPTALAGTLHCLGGSGVDLTSQLDNLHLDAQPTQAMIGFSLGADGGPGSALLLLPSAVANITGSASDCLTRDWSGDPVYPLPFTTGTVTGTIVNADGIPGSALVMTATGENFDCARWSDENGPGILEALPFLSPNTTGAFNGDVIAQLTLASHEPIAVPQPTPTATPAGTEIGGELAAIVDEILVPHCALPSCHSSQSAFGALVLERSAAYDQLVGVIADNAAARAGGWVRVTPGDPDASFLLRKLRGDLSAGEGGRMPLNGAALAPEEIDRIRAWIASGAAPGV